MNLINVKERCRFGSQVLNPFLPFPLSFSSSSSISTHLFLSNFSLDLELSLFVARPRRRSALFHHRVRPIFRYFVLLRLLHRLTVRIFYIIPQNPSNRKIIAIAVLSSSRRSAHLKSSFRSWYASFFFFIYSFIFTLIDVSL